MGARHTVSPGTPNGEQAGVIPIALFKQHIEGPFQARKNREGRSPKADDSLSTGILERLLRLPHVLAKLLVGQGRNPAMPEAVRGHFMASPGNPSHQQGETTRDPS